MAQLTTESAIANLEQTEDTSLRYYAAWWLGKYRIRDKRAIAALLQALEDEKDRSPDGGYPLRRNAARALGKVGDRSAVAALTARLDDSDYYVREAAAQALEEIGDPSCVPKLRQMLAGGVEAAVSVEGKPHLVQPYEGIIEALGTLADPQAIADIEPFLEHPVEKVQLATARAMYQLTGKIEYGNLLVRGLQASKLPLRRSALMDLGATDYLPGAEAIGRAAIENSLKLIALKGLLENHLKKEPDPLAPKNARLLDLMDSLL